MKTYVLSCCGILLATLTLLELTSYFAYEPLTGKKFSYKTAEEERLLLIGELGKNPDSSQFETKARTQFHPYVGYVNKPGVHP